MIRKLFKDGIVYTISTFLSKGVAFFLIPVLTSFLTTKEFGIVDYYIVIGALANFIVGFEITQGLARYIVDASYEDQIRYSSTALCFTLVSYSIMTIVLFAFSEELNEFITGDSSYLNVYVWAMASIIFYGLFYFFQNHLRWTFKVKENGIINVIYTMLSFGLATALIVFKNLGLEGYFIGTSVGAGVSAIISWYVNRKFFRFYFSREFLKPMLRYSFPLIFSGGAVLFSTYVDRIMIKSFLDYDALGIYGLGYRFVALASLVVIGFRSALTPLIFKNYAADSTPKQIAKVLRYFILLAVLVVVFFLFFSEELILFLSNENYILAKMVIPILVIGSFIGNMYMFAPGMSIHKKTSWIAYISILGMCVNGLLNFVLIPKMGIVGGAVATSFSAIFVFSLYLFLNQKLYRIPYDWRQMLKAILVLIFAFTLNLVMPMAIQDILGVFYSLIEIALWLFMSVCIIIVLIPVAELKSNMNLLKSWLS